jgi:tetratricopeptide (TPR) repeat protein
MEPERGKGRFEMSQMSRFGYVLLALGLATSTLGCNLFTILDKLSARDELNKGVKAYTSQKYGEAVEHLQLATELDPGLIDAELYLATTYRVQYEPGSQSMDNLQMAQKAIQIFERVLEKDPGNESSMANISGIYNSMGDYDLAKEWYRKQLEANPSNPEPLYGIGTIDWQLSYDRTGMIGDNVENLTDEEKAEVNGTVDEGVEALRKALEIYPQYTDAMQYLNLLYREKGKLASDDEEKANWEMEADKLALQALEMKRMQEEEAERAKRTFTGATESE